MENVKHLKYHLISDNHILHIVHYNSQSIYIICSYSHITFVVKNTGLLGSRTLVPMHIMTNRLVIWKK